MYPLQVRSASWSARTYDVVGARLAVVKGNEQYEIKISGTSTHQEELELVAGGRRPDGAHHQRCTALLLPEPDCREDANAVGVVIEGMQVGYLERDQALAFGQSLRQSGCVAAICVAEVVKHRDQSNGEAGRFGVRLDAFLPFEIDCTVMVQADGRMIVPPDAVAIETEIMTRVAASHDLPEPRDVVPLKASPMLAARRPLGAGLWTTGALSILAIVTVMTLAKLGYAPKDLSDYKRVFAVPSQTDDDRTGSIPVPARDIFRTEFPNVFSKK